MAAINYSVYMHTTPSGKKYVGMTYKEPKLRWNNGKGYSCNKYFFDDINKYGWKNIKHEVLFSGLSEYDARIKEMELIAEYNTNDRMYGYNLTAGGETSRAKGWTQIAIQLPEELLEQVKAEAERQMIPIAAVVRLAMVEYLKKHKKKGE